MMNVLQTIPIVPADSLNQVQAEIVAVAEKIATTPTEQLLSDLGSHAVTFGLKVLTAIIIYCIGAWLIKKFKVILTRIFVKRNTEASIVSFVQSMTSIALTIILIIITVGALGIDTTSIAALLAGGGMAIGMALNGTVQNFAGGIMILVFRPFKAGDFIEAQGFSGTVKEVTIVSTKLVTVDNRNIIIPNGALSNGTINNYSQNDYRRVDWLVDVEYGTKCDSTKEILMSILKDDERILTVEKGAPADPFVALNALRDSSIQFVLKAWVKASDYWPVNYDINEKIYTKLPENGISFPFPQLDVNLKNS
ncbi:MAG: mechanosensitive ion channel family protein [Candidatus Cryptobacteroides sp.]